MKKLILASLGIISISLLFRTFIKNDNNLDKKILNNSHIKTSNNNLEIENIALIPKKNQTSTILKNNHQETISKKPNYKGKETKEKKIYLSYLNYRKEQHQIETRKMNHYLTHQKELKYIREGGVKSKLEREKRRDEIQFQNHYKSIMMSQKTKYKESFIKHKEEIERRREQMHSLQEKQQLQTKYRGEL